MYASREIVYDEAFADTPSPSSTLSPLPPASSLFTSVTCPSPHPSPPPPAPRAVRRLTMEKQQEANCTSRSMSPTAAVESPRPPSPECAASSSVGESPLPPDLSPESPVVYCSQYRVVQHAQQNGPPPVAVAVGWLCDASDGPSSPPPARYPTPPAAPRKDQHIQNSDSECSDNCDRLRAPPAAYLFRDGGLLFHKTYQGRRPFTFVDTCLYKGGRHDWYGVHNERDLVWARRHKLVLEQHTIPRQAPAAPALACASWPGGSP